MFTKKSLVVLLIIFSSCKSDDKQNIESNKMEVIKKNTEIDLEKRISDEDKRAYIEAKANVLKNGAGFIYVDNELEKKFVDKDDKNNFDNVFSSRTQLTQNNTPQNNTQQKSTPKDPYLENLMHQRNMQDKKLATLMRLRGNK